MSIQVHGSGRPRLYVASSTGVTGLSFAMYVIYGVAYCVQGPIDGDPEKKWDLTTHNAMVAYDIVNRKWQRYRELAYKSPH